MADNAESRSGNQALGAGVDPHMGDLGAEAQIEQYLETVSAQLGAATVTEREKITGEVAAHIYESLRTPGENIETVLAHLGAPEKLGERYREVLNAEQASRSYWPMVLLMASFRRGIFGILAGLIGLAGYWLGGILFVFGLLELVWAASHAGAHKPVPIGASLGNIFEVIGIGCFFLVFSTTLLRITLRRLRRRQSPL